MNNPYTSEVELSNLAVSRDEKDEYSEMQQQMKRDQHQKEMAIIRQRHEKAEAEFQEKMKIIQEKDEELRAEGALWIKLAVKLIEAKLQDGTSTGNWEDWHRCTTQFSAELIQGKLTPELNSAIKAWLSIGPMHSEDNTISCTAYIPAGSVPTPSNPIVEEKQQTPGIEHKKN